MLLYSIIMFAVAVLFAVLSLLIYRGKTNLIHDYHQTKVEDKVGYGKAFGRALSPFAFAPLVSGVIALFARAESLMTVAILVLVIGMGVGIALIARVQVKYNKGIF